MLPPRSCSRSWLARLALSLASFGVAAPLAAEPLVVELSDQVDWLATVPEFRVAPDGSRVVFRTMAEPPEVLSVPIEGGEAADLTPPGTEAAVLVDVAPDGSRVLITARFPGELTEVFSTPFAGGGVTQLNPDLAAGVAAIAGPITPDSTGVVYGTRTPCAIVPPSLVSCPVELFSVPLAGGASTPLDVPDLPLDGPLAPRRLFSIGPDSQVGVSAMLERLDEDDNFDPDPVLLFSTPLAGGGSTVLHEGGVFEPPFAFTPTGERVVYRRSGELHSASVASGSPVKLNPPLAAPGSVREFFVTEDGARVVYGANQDEDFNEVHSVPVAGGPTTKLSHPEGVTEAFPWLVTPDGGRAVFAQHVGAPPEHVLFSVPVTGGERTRLSPPLVPDAPGDFDSILPIAAVQASADGARVVYAAQQEVDDVWDLYATPAEGGPVVRLGGPLARGGSFFEAVSARFRISPDGTRVVFAADTDLDGAFEVHAVPIVGGVATQLSAPLEPDQNVFPSSMEISAESRHVLFLVTRPGLAPAELHSARLPPVVRIDVRPGVERPLPKGRSAKVAVALLGSAEVDVAEVALETLAFGPDGAAPHGRPRLVDVDRDGFPDLVTRYRVGETGLASGDTEACLSGSHDGFAFRSCDVIATR